MSDITDAEALARLLEVDAGVPADLDLLRAAARFLRKQEAELREQAAEIEATRRAHERTSAMLEHERAVYSADAARMEVEIERYKALYNDEIRHAAGHGEAAQAEITSLRAALEWFADEGHYPDTYRRGAGYIDTLGVNVARAALLGMNSDDDDAVADAWSKRPR